MPSCHFVHLILLSSGPKVPKSGPFKNEGIHESGILFYVVEKAPDTVCGSSVARGADFAGVRVALESSKIFSLRLGEQNSPSKFAD